MIDMLLKNVRKNLLLAMTISLEYEYEVICTISCQFSFKPDERGTNGLAQRPRVVGLASFVQEKQRH